MKGKPRAGETVRCALLQWGYVRRSVTSCLFLTPGASERRAKVQTRKIFKSFHEGLVPVPPDAPPREGGRSAALHRAYRQPRARPGWHRRPAWRRRSGSRWRRVQAMCGFAALIANAQRHRECHEVEQAEFAHHRRCIDAAARRFVGRTGPSCRARTRSPGLRRHGPDHV